jgi:hypothetical protein
VEGRSLPNSTQSSLTKLKLNGTARFEKKTIAGEQNVFYLETSGGQNYNPLNHHFIKLTVDGIIHRGLRRLP